MPVVPLRMPFVPHSTLEQLEASTAGGHASYNSLQTLFRSQLGNSTFQAAYTWSHSIGNVEEDNSSGSFNQQAITVQGQPVLDKGSTNINRPNIFVMNEVYYLPSLPSQTPLCRIRLAGGRSTASSPLPTAVRSLLRQWLLQRRECLRLIGTGYIGNNRPLTVCWNDPVMRVRRAAQILNASYFSLVGYVLGTAPANMEKRGSCFGAPTTNLDMHNWLRTGQIKERYRVKFAMDFFDLFNHPNFNSNALEGTGYAPSTLTLRLRGMWCRQTPRGGL